MARFAVVVSLVMGLGLTGCALPPALTIASYFLDVASYFATGKGPSENILSAAMGQDCGLLHVFQGKEICLDYPGQMAGSVVGEGKTSDVDDDTHRFLVVGSFVDSENASRLAAALVGFNLNIIDIEADGRTIHQVIAGPLNDDDVTALRERLATPNLLPVRELGELAELSN